MKKLDDLKNSPAEDVGLAIYRPIELQAKISCSRDEGMGRDGGGEYVYSSWWEGHMDGVGNW